MIFNPITIEVLKPIGFELEDEIQIGVLKKAIEAGFVRIVDGHLRFQAAIEFGNSDEIIKIMKVVDS